MQLCHISAPVLALALLVPVLTCVAIMSPPERTYNILMMTPVGSKSHRNVFFPLATELTKRGHKVTLVSNYPPEDNNTNITYIEHGLPYFQANDVDMFELRTDWSKSFELLKTQLQLIAKHFYTIPIIKDLYSRRDDFDLIVVNSIFNEVALPFTYRKLFISLASSGNEPVHSAMMGNILKPAYANTGIQLFRTPFTFWERIKNLVITIVVPIVWRNRVVLPATQPEISKQFPSLPPLLEMERNQSLVLLNSHFSLSTPLPLLPAQIEVGGMHCRPGKPLPKDINDFVAGKEPVVYFSLGSYAKGTTMPLLYQKMFVSAFSKLPYKLLWKFEAERDDLPKNIMIKHWMPQQDILAHPNVKLFISHCGLMSTQEAMYHATPVLALPISADQPRNSQQVEINGIGKTLVWEELSEDLIINTVKDIISMPSYRDNVSRISVTYKDQPQSPVERAVFWTEYVIRHSGALHLRSPERDLTWVEVLHLDILFALHSLLFLLVWCLWKLFRLCVGIRSQKNTKSKRE